MVGPLPGHGRARQSEEEVDARIRGGGKGAIRDIAADTFPLMFDHACQDRRDVAARITVPVLIVPVLIVSVWIVAGGRGQC